jgi:hypothetical protein
VVHQPGQVLDAGLAAGPDCVFEGVEHEICGHPSRGPPADDAPAEDVEDERDIDRAGPGRDVGEVGNPELVGAAGHELAIDQVRGPLGVLVGNRGAYLLGPQRSGPALLGIEPLDRAPGHVEPLRAQV